MFVFLVLDRFVLVIQRCKNVTGRGNLFDQGGDWLDESKNCPTKGFLQCGPPSAARENRPPPQNKAAAGVFPRRQFFCQGQRCFRLFRGIWM